MKGVITSGPDFVNACDVPFSFFEGIGNYHFEEDDEESLLFTEDTSCSPEVHTCYITEYDCTYDII